MDFLLKSDGSIADEGWMIDAPCIINNQP